MHRIKRFFLLIFVISCITGLCSCSSSRNYPSKKHTHSGKKHQSKMQRKYRKYDCGCFILFGPDNPYYIDKDGR